MNKKGLKNAAIFALNNLKDNIKLLASTAAALCLFITPSRTSWLLAAAIFAMTVFLVCIGNKWSGRAQGRFAKAGAVLLTAFFALWGVSTFFPAWRSSERFASAARAIGISGPALTAAAAVIALAAGLYAMYSLSRYIIDMSAQALDGRSATSDRDIAGNLKRNWYFPISAAAFFCLSATLTAGYLIGLVIAVTMFTVAAARIRSIWDYVSRIAIGIKAVSALSALGILWWAKSAFYAHWSISPKSQAIAAHFNFPIDVAGVISMLGAMAAYIFVFVCTAVFFDRLIGIFIETGMFKDITRAEVIIYSVMLLAFIAFITAAFSKSQAFYGTCYDYDIIYTADSPLLMRENVYLGLTHPENDLRQPLFAVFAAPFIGIPYFFGRLFGASQGVLAMLIDYVQAALLLASGFILAKAMELSPGKRICFMLLNCVTYTYILFSVMMEQYIIAGFWLMLCLYLICGRRYRTRMAYYGAAGTLLIGLAATVCMSERSPFKNFKAWVEDMLKCAFGFAAVQLAFCRFDVIYALTSKAEQLGRYTGRTVTLADKIYQYTAFVRNCFAAPRAGISQVISGHISWQLDPIAGISVIGVVIIILSAIGAFVSRDKMSTRLAAGWALLSAAVLVILGWGTAENGLILYSLYFGWVFMVLLFELVGWIENRLNIRFLLPAVSIGCAAWMAVLNVPAMIDLLSFAATHFRA